MLEVLRAMQAPPGLSATGGPRRGEGVKYGSSNLRASGKAAPWIDRVPMLRQ